MTKPLAIDLFTGLHGWAEGLIAAGWRVIGVDIEDMSRSLGEPMPEGDFLLIIQNVLTLHGSQLKDARLIVGSSPCPEFSYRAMPWKRAKALGPPELGIELFNAQFRIRREAEQAAGRPIPLVVENVCGAQPWVGQARAHFGSYYLWGDLPELMPVAAARKVAGFRFDGSGGSFQTAAVNEHTKNDHGGSWFKIGSPGQKVTGQNPDGRLWVRDPVASCGSSSPKRKAASAKIAKIPFPLAYWIGLSHHPDTTGPSWSVMAASDLRHKYAFTRSRADDMQISLFEEINGEA